MIKSSLLISMCGILVVSCDFIKQSDKPEEQEPEKPVFVWDWDKQKQAEELQLGTKRVNIQPKQSVEVLANAAGKLTLLMDKRQDDVSKGFHFAQMDREKLQNEKVKLDIEARAQSVERTREEEFARPIKIREAEKLLEEARKYLAQIELIRNSPSLKKNASEIFGADFKNLKAEDYELAKQDFDLAKRQLDMMKEVDDDLYEDQLHLQKLQREEALKSYEEKKESSEYKTSFKGELRIELPDYVPGQTEYAVTSRTSIATLNDYEEMHALLAIEGAAWVRLDPGSLLIRLKDSKDTEMPYSEEKVVKNTQTRREERSYVFALPTETNPDLKRLSGTTLEADLIAKLGKPCYIVNKVDVAKLATMKKSNFKLWPDIVNHIWPGAKVLAVGHREVAVDYDPSKKDGEEKPLKKEGVNLE